ncbi:hypothetical protein AB2N04_16455 [Nitratireductor sp. GISD-1A_MAKvit]
MSVSAAASFGIKVAGIKVARVEVAGIVFLRTVSSVGAQRQAKS